MLHSSRRHVERLAKFHRDLLSNIAQTRAINGLQLMPIVDHWFEANLQERRLQCCTLLNGPISVLAGMRPPYRAIADVGRCAVGQAAAWRAKRDRLAGFESLFV